MCCIWDPRLETWPLFETVLSDPIDHLYACYGVKRLARYGSRSLGSQTVIY